MVISESFKAIVDTTQQDRARVRSLVAHGHWQEAEPDKSRLAGYVGRTSSFLAARGAEAIQGDTNDLQPVSFLAIGARVQRAVGYVEVMAAGESSCGSGFLISPNLLLTNAHVIPDAQAARGAQVIFDRQMGPDGRPLATTSFLLDPDRLALFSPEGELDYALIALGGRQSGTAEASTLGFCPLSNRPDKHRLGMSVNIVQHPQGFPKLIAVRDNLLMHRTSRTLLYETDTKRGSSGSPVFNDMWEVIALHHWGEPFLEMVDDTGEPIPRTVNEGVRISAIYADLERRLPGLPNRAGELLETALSYDIEPPAAAGDRTLGPPRPTRGGQEAATLGGRDMPMSGDGDELKVVIPIEVTVRVGGGGLASVATSGAARGGVRGGVSTSAGAALTRGAARTRVDRDYADRSGYVDRFIPGAVIGLPVPGAELAKQVAPLRAGETDFEKGVLRYEHFSVVLNKARRMAMFTATNIDGRTYLNVDRKTGRAEEASEGETWYLDPRISQSFVLDQSFYSAWSTYFDRGHLTRRMDPNWGEPEEAERGNADTYHFTNCSPQHFRFNQTTRFWQGAERYILEKGVLANDSEAKLCVFQGPIFSDAIDRYADDVQIPSSFFKVIVWRGEAGLRAVGLVVDQLALLDEKRVSLRQTDDGAPVSVNQWRVPITDIEERTGLSFGDDVRSADTIAETAQPSVGEAQRLITEFADIRL